MASSQRKVSKLLDGRPRFAKRSFGDGLKVKIAAIDPDSVSGISPVVLDGFCWPGPYQHFGFETR